MHRHDHGFRFVQSSGLVSVFSLLMASFVAKAQPVDDFIPVTDEMPQQSAAEDWLMSRRTLDNWGY